MSTVKGNERKEREEKMRDTSDRDRRCKPGQVCTPTHSS